MRGRPRLILLSPPKFGDFCLVDLDSVLECFDLTLEAARHLLLFNELTSLEHQLVVCVLDSGLKDDQLLLVLAAGGLELPKLLLLGL